MVVYYPGAQSSISMLLGWLEVRPCILSLEDRNHLFPNQRYIGDKRISEWIDIFRVGPKHHNPTENQYSIYHLLVMYEVLASIITVRGITCGNWSYQIIPQPVTEGLSIYSVKSSDVLFNRFQGLGPVPWINSRYHFRVLVGFLHFPLVIHCAYLRELNIWVRARAPNHCKNLCII